MINRKKNPVISRRVYVIIIIKRNKVLELGKRFQNTPRSSLVMKRDERFVSTDN